MLLSSSTAEAGPSHIRRAGFLLKHGDANAPFDDVGHRCSVRTATKRRSQGAIVRVLLIAGIGLIEAIAISFFYDTPRSEVPPSAIIGFVWQFAAVSVQAAILAIGAFAILNWHQRFDLLHKWQASLQDHKFGTWLASNFCVLLATIAASIAISASMEVYTRWLWPYFALLALLGATLMLSAAPAKVLAPVCWRRLGCR